MPDPGLWGSLAILACAAVGGPAAIWVVTHIPMTDRLTKALITTCICLGIAMAAIQADMDGLIPVKDIVRDPEILAAHDTVIEVIKTISFFLPSHS